MKLFSYVFEDREDREMAFLNIVKWYGSSGVEKIENLGLSVRGTKEVLVEVCRIIEKHSGRLKSEIFGIS